MIVVLFLLFVMFLFSLLFVGTECNSALSFTRMFCHIRTIGVANPRHQTAYISAPSGDGKIPTEVVIEDKTAVEQMRLIQQIEADDKQTIFKLIDKMLTIKKFKDFFAKNVATL